MKEKEIWKDVVGYEGFYKISSYGRLKRLGGYRKIVRKDGKEYSVFRPESILKNELTKKGYHRNDLYGHDGTTNVKERVRIHRLVAEAFIGLPPENKNQVNHINGIKTDNFYKNLEWCDGKENVRHAILNGLMKRNKKVNPWQLSLPFK